MLRSAAVLSIVVHLACAQGRTVDRDAAIERLRTFGQNYGSRLQDFSCNKLVSRQEARVGKENEWKSIGTSEEEINYIGHNETSRLLAIDGTPVVGRTRIKHGVTIGGEFGLLGIIFAPKAKAELVWDTESGPPGLCAVRYRVDKSTSPMRIQMGRTRIETGHHGRLVFACETGIVTQLASQSDPVANRNLGLRTFITFAPAIIGERQFQLPQAVENATQFGKELEKSTVVFKNYRKYDASSAIRFETDDQPR